MMKIIAIFILIIFQFTTNVYARRHSIQELQDVIRAGKCCENGVENSEELWGKHPSSVELMQLLLLWYGFPENSDFNSLNYQSCRLFYPDGKEKEGDFRGPCPTGSIKVTQEVYDRDIAIAIKKNEQKDKCANSSKAQAELIARNSNLQSICMKISGISASLKEEISARLQVHPDAITFNRYWFEPISIGESNVTLLARWHDGVAKVDASDWPSCGMVVYSPRGPINLVCSSSMIFDKHNYVVSGCRIR